MFGFSYGWDKSGSPRGASNQLALPKPPFCGLLPLENDWQGIIPSTSGFALTGRITRRCAPLLRRFPFHLRRFIYAVNEAAVRFLIGVCKTPLTAYSFTDNLQALAVGRVLLHAFPCQDHVSVILIFFGVF